MLINIQHIETLFNIKLPILKSNFKKAYRKKAMELHPDHGGNKDAFTNMNTLYNQLLPCVDYRVFLDYKKPEPTRVQRIVIHGNPWNWNMPKSPFPRAPRPGVKVDRVQDLKERKDLIEKWRKEFQETINKHREILNRFR